MWNKNKSNRRKINIYTRKWFKIYLKVVSLISVCASRFKYNSSHAFSPIAEKKIKRQWTKKKSQFFVYFCVKFFEINIQSGLVLPDISLGWFSEKRHGWYAKKGKSIQGLIELKAGIYAVQLPWERKTLPASRNERQVQKLSLEPSWTINFNSNFTFYSAILVRLHKISEREQELFLRSKIAMNKFKSRNKQWIIKLCRVRYRAWTLLYSNFLRQPLDLTCHVNDPPRHVRLEEAVSLLISSSFRYMYAFNAKKHKCHMKNI